MQGLLLWLRGRRADAQFAEAWPIWIDDTISGAKVSEHKRDICGGKFGSGVGDDAGYPSTECRGCIGVREKRCCRGMAFAGRPVTTEVRPK